jgi:hypothetical protein
VLADMLDTAQRLKRRSPGYCANRTWYRVLKPILVKTVGWSGEVYCRGHIQQLSDLMDGKEPEHDDECQREWDRQRWIKTPAAYDLAYQHLYDALPDCQHPEGTICW